MRRFLAERADVKMRRTSWSFSVETEAAVRSARPSLLRFEGAKRRSIGAKLASAMPTAIWPAKSIYVSIRTFEIRLVREQRTPTDDYNLGNKSLLYAILHTS